MESSKPITINDVHPKPKEGIRICYTADLHGNINQYKNLYKLAVGTNSDYILIGGDLNPKNPWKSTEKEVWGKLVPHQRDFLLNKLVPELNSWKGNIPTYFTFGNADFADNYDAFELQLASISTGSFQILQNGFADLKDGYRLFGYPYVPLSPFWTKDYEKKDFTDPTANKSASTYEGVISFDAMLHEYRVPEDECDSIENDFKMLWGDSKALNFEKLIGMIHAPPANTCIDVNSKKCHVGSHAIRNAIHTYQPLITLHGHIHETVMMSGRYREFIGNTSCYGVGNFWGPDPVMAIIVDTSEPSMGQRVIFPFVEKAKKEKNNKKNS
eukprot:TRINITY_DN8514_c0_g1_i1.p1 TRINITY_DN8514_c0_g1~~TRINITY_DN8514_c0_g1_i1.p1  ORF type:complete len:327 (+),score=18.91 TRINITY_DN8514_c0_g1_i1:3-983(+)